MTCPAHMPHGAWPRGLKLEWAAAYRGVSPNTFLAEVEAGIMPKPEKSGRRNIWDISKVNKAMDRRVEPEGDPLMEALDDSAA